VTTRVRTVPCERRRDGGVAEVQLRLLDVLPGLLDGRLRDLDLGLGLLVLLLAGGPALVPLLDPGRGGGRELLLRDGRRHRRLRLAERDLERLGVDLEERVAGFDLGALLEEHLLHVPAHPSAHVGRLHRGKSAGHLGVSGHRSNQRRRGRDLRRAGVLRLRGGASVVPNCGEDEE
jgi:hypothetical protein